MKKQKLDELDKQRPLTEEQQEFLETLTKKIKKDGVSLQTWIDNFKKEHGIDNEQYV